MLILLQSILSFLVKAKLPRCVKEGRKTDGKVTTPPPPTFPLSRLRNPLLPFVLLSCLLCTLRFFFSVPPPFFSLATRCVY